MFQIWLSYSPVADYTASFYHINSDKVNWLSLVFPIAALPFGFLATWTLDSVGLRTAVRLKIYVTWHRNYPLMPTDYRHLSLIMTLVAPCTQNGLAVRAHGRTNANLSTVEL